MRIRRVLLVAATALVASMAITALLSPVPDTREPTTDHTRTPADSSPDPSPPRSDREPARVSGEGFALVVVSASDSERRVEIPVGRAVRLRVEAQEPAAVQLGEDGPIEYAAEGAPAEFAVFGDSDLDEPLTLVESGQVLARVVSVDAAD